MGKCLLCSGEYERKSHGRMICAECDVRLDRTMPQYQTLGERLWGRCFFRLGCWEFGAAKADGRPNSIRADRRQVPPAHVALHLSGRPRPSALHVVEHAQAAQPMCINPEHLAWVEMPRPRGQMWAHLMSDEQLREHLERQSAKRAKYQRTWRRHVKDLGGVKSVRQARAEQDMARLRDLTTANVRTTPTPLVPLPERIVVESPPRRVVRLPDDVVERYAKAIDEGIRIMAAEATPELSADATPLPERQRIALWRHSLRETAPDAPEPASRLIEAPTDPISVAPPAVKPMSFLASLASPKIAPVD